MSMQEQAVTSPGSTEDVPPTNPVKETASLRRSVLDSSKRGITISEAELKKCLDDVGGLDSIIITRLLFSSSLQSFVKFRIIICRF